MRYFVLLLSSVLLLFSCKKDKKAIVYTSDAPETFESYIRVGYDQDDNLTSVSAYFSAEISSGITKSVVMDENSRILYNGTELEGEYRNILSVSGKHAVNLEFVNSDQTVYTNAFDVPDTVYFKNLPDTISASQNLTINFGGSQLASDETYELYFLGANVHELDGYFGSDVQTDSTVLVDPINFEAGQEYTIHLKREKILKYPKLPNGGGRVKYRYDISKTIYAE